jgi:hypothetical protein
MRAIGPAMQLGEVRAYADKAAWALTFDEDRIILAEHDREETAGVPYAAGVTLADLATVPANLIDTPASWR